jgi:hypothetical protein
MQTASSFEIAWTVMAAIGLVFYVVLGWYAIGDKRYLGTPVDGIPERRALTSRQIIATQNISVSLLLGGIDVSLIIGGVVAMLIPPSSPSRGLTLTGAVLLLSLFAVHVFLIAVALVLFISRTRLLAKIEADREHLALLAQIVIDPEKL